MPHQFPSVGPSSVGAIVTGTPDVQASTVMERNSDGDSNVNVMYAAKGVRSAGHLYIDQQSESANVTIDESTQNGTVYNVTTAASTITVTLPAASGVTDKIIAIKKVDTGAGTVIIDADSSETIEGKTTFTLYTAGDIVWIQSDGSNWRIVHATLSPAVIAKSASFTADDQPLTEFVYICDTTSGSITATLPAASGLKGRKLTFKKIVSGNNLVLDANSSETIDNATTKTSATEFASYRIICDGSEWWNISTAGTWT